MQVRRSKRRALALISDRCRRRHPLVALTNASASISMARSEAAVSVVK